VILVASVTVTVTLNINIDVNIPDEKYDAPSTRKNAEEKAR